MKLGEKHFTKISNIYPPLRESTEKQVPTNMEVLVKTDGLYFFSPFFKLSKEILDAVLKKYEYNPKEKLLSEELTTIKGKKDKVFIAKIPETENKNSDLIASFVSSIDKKGPPIFGKLQNVAIEKYYLTKQGIVIDTGDDPCNTQLLEVVSAQNGKIVQHCDDGAITEITSSPRIRSLLNELMLLNSNPDIKLDPHPYRKMTSGFKKDYLEILLHVSCFNQSLSADQVIRLEVISRQFNISSSWIKNKLALESLKLDQSTRGERIKTLINKITVPDQTILLADMLSLDLLRRKYCSEVDSLIKNIDKLLKISYSEVMQIKQYLEKIY